MRILLFGREGQLGSELCQALAGNDALSAYGMADADLTAFQRLREIVRDEKPELVINAAAYTAVDKAEQEAELAAKVNAEAPGVIARSAAEIGATMIHYSTDYVFDGTAGRPYVEEDEPHPQSVYGTTKLAGEQAVLSSGVQALVLRTSWVYSMHGQNFLRTMLRLAAERDELRIVGDQYGSPTSTTALTDGTLALVEAFREQGHFAAEKLGLYHMTCAGQTSWCGFARAIIAASPYADTRVTEIGTAEYPTPARRPAYSVLSNAKLQRNFGIRLPDWQAALRQCMQAGDEGTGVVTD